VFARRTSAVGQRPGPVFTVSWDEPAPEAERCQGAGDAKTGRRAASFYKPHVIFAIAHDSHGGCVPAL